MSGAMSGAMIPAPTPAPPAALVALRFGLHRGTGRFSRVIQRWGRGPYSHVSILLDDAGASRDGSPWLLEAIEGQGVVTTRTLADARVREVVDVATVYVSAIDRQAALAWARTQCGKGYDVPSVLDFGLGVVLPQRNVQGERKAAERWFCSELGTAVSARAHRPVQRCDPWLVDPNWFARSALFRAPAGKFEHDPRLLDRLADARVPFGEADLGGLP